MRIIGKYQLNVEPELHVMLPRGAEMLSVGVQDLGTISIWAIIDTNETPVENVFTVIATGKTVETLTDQDKYIGTAVDGEGLLVWHIWRRVKDVRG